MFWHGKNRKTPCPWMTGVLNRVLDERAGPVGQWYARMHAKACNPCRIYLEEIADNKLNLRQARQSPPREVLERLSLKIAEAAKLV